MKFYFAPLFLFIKLSPTIAQPAPLRPVNPDSVLTSVSGKLNSLGNIRYNSTRELNYSSENYKNTSGWAIYDDFQSRDTLTGVKYQITDSTSKQFFNGTEKFDLDTKLKTIAIDDHPSRKTFGGLSALYNSIVTLKNILPLLIADKSANKSATDTIINNTACIAVRINIGKRRIQNLGFGFDAMTTKSDFIYDIIVDKSSRLPVEVVQINDINSDFIKTSFVNIEINTTAPSELSWYYSTYTGDFKPAGQKQDIQLLSKGELAPDWKLETYNTNETVSLSDLKGQVVLVDFWIKNCGPCIESVPHLVELQSKFRNKHFKLISINAYDSKEEVNGFCKKHNTDYPVLLNGKPVAEKYGVGAFPTFFIIDKTGKIIYANTGYSESAQAEVERIVEAAL